MDIISLDTEWTFKLDPENQGIQQDWPRQPEKLATGSRSITVPSCWEEQEEDYQGVAWYQTVVPIATDQAGKVCRIRFEAANYRTQVWVNGHNVGLHEGGYTPFEFQIQQALLYGENNTITVRVISPIITEDRQIDGLSTNDMPHWRGGLTAGLWQSVSLHFNRAAWIESAFYKPDVAQSAFHLDLNVHSQHTESSPYTLQVTLHDASGQEVVTHNSQVELQQGEQLLKASLCLENPILWDCDNPHLYTAVASLNDGQSKLDQSEERIGLREFTYVNDHFELNGQRIYLRGGFWEGVYAKHQSYPESREEVRREIKLAQEAGFNLLRPWRRPVPPMILEEADAAGLLIIASPAVECMSCWPSLTPETPQRIEYEIRSLVRRDRNHPSIIWWEMFNEVTREALAELITPMSLIARELDPTRLILDESGGWASGAHFYHPHTTERKKLAELHSYVRAPVSNKHWQLYQSLGLSNIKEGHTEIKSGMGIFVSEFGFGGLPEIDANCRRFQQHGNAKLPAYRHFHKLQKDLNNAIDACELRHIYPELDTFCRESQQIQARGNRRQLEALLSNPLISGYCIHAFTDGDWIIGAALIDNWQQPKAAYHAIADANHNGQLLAFPIQRNLDSGREARIRVIFRQPEEACPNALQLSGSLGEVTYTELNWSESRPFRELEIEIDSRWICSGANVFTLTALNAAGASSYRCQIELYAVETAAIDPDVQLVVYDPNADLDGWLQTHASAATPLSDWAPNSSSAATTVFLFANEDVAQEADLALVEAALKEVAAGNASAIFIEAPCQHESGGMLREYDASQAPDYKTNQLVQSGIFPFQLSARPSFAFWESSMHIAKSHAIFAGLPQDQMMDEPYHEIAPVESFYQLTAEELPSQSITWFRPEDEDKAKKRTFLGGEDVWYGSNLAVKQHGAGHIILSTLILRSKVSADPVAARVLCNMVAYASELTAERSSTAASLA